MRHGAANPRISPCLGLPRQYFNGYYSQPVRGPVMGVLREHKGGKYTPGRAEEI